MGEEQEKAGEEQPETERRRECDAEHLTPLIQELADLPVIQCCAVY